MLEGCSENHPVSVTKTEIISDSVTQFRLQDVSKRTVLNVSINCPGSSSAEFYLTPAAIDFGSYQTLIAGIIQLQMSDKEKAISLWSFTSRWSKMGIPPARNREPCDPLKLFNSIEFALCGGINAALANLDSIAGLRSRVYHLSGHVVSEVFYNNDWHMFDADRSVYFLNDKKEIASVNYIAGHPEVIEAQKDKIRNWAGMKFSYKMMQRVYSSKQNNSVNDWFKKISYNYNNRLILGKNDTINFKVCKAGSVEKAKKIIGAHAKIDFLRSGSLRRNVSLSEEKQNNEFVFKEQSPYLIKSVCVSLKKQKTPGNTTLSVYYSPDGGNWYFKGVVSGFMDKIFFSATNSNNESGAFSYFLKFIPDSPHVASSNSLSIFVENDFLFSDKIFANGDNSFKLVFSNKKPGDSLSVTISETLNP